MTYWTPRKLVLALLIIIYLDSITIVVQGKEQVHKIQKRSSVDLGFVVGCAQNKGGIFTPIWTTARYGKYGCHCGFGGGGNPVDNTDRCCQQHDKFWDDLISRAGKSVLSAVLTSYRYKCKRRPGEVTCKDSIGTFKKDLCECDRAFAYCVANNKHSYSNRFRNHKRSKC